MKRFFKGLLLFIVGFIVVLFIYPILHELGHSLLAITVGAKVEEFNLFPIPNVLCSILNVNGIGTVLIGYGGILLPVIVSILMRPKNFVLWYVNFILKCINIFSVIEAFISLAMFLKGTPMKNDDMTAILTVKPAAVAGTVLFLLLCLAVTIYLLKRDKIIERCYYFLYNKDTNNITIN